MQKLIAALLCITMLFSFSVVAFAADEKSEFRHSPERNTVEFVISVDENGNEYFGRLLGDDSENLPIGNLVLSDINYNTNIDISKLSPEDKKILDEANERFAELKKLLNEAESLFDIFGTDVLSPDNRYVTTALFNLIALGDLIKAIETLFAEGGLLEVTLKIKVPTDREFYFAVLNKEDKWIFLEEDQVKVNDDGTVTLKLKSVGPIVLIEAVGPSGEIVESPQ